MERVGGCLNFTNAGAQSRGAVRRVGWSGWSGPGDVRWTSACAPDCRAVERALAGRANAVVKEVSVAINGHKPSASTTLTTCGLSQGGTPPRSRALRMGKRLRFFLRHAGRAIAEKQLTSAGKEPAPGGQLDRPLRVAGDHHHRAKNVPVGERNGELGNVARYGDALDGDTLEPRHAALDPGTGVGAAVEDRRLVFYAPVPFNRNACLSRRVMAARRSDGGQVPQFKEDGRAVALPRERDGQPDQWLDQRGEVFDGTERVGHEEPHVVALTRGPTARRVGQLPSDLVILPSHSATVTTRDLKVHLQLNPAGSTARLAFRRVHWSLWEHARKFRHPARSKKQGGPLEDHGRDFAKAIERTVLEETPIEGQKSVATEVGIEHDCVQGGLERGPLGPRRAIATKRVSKSGVQFDHGGLYASGSRLGVQRRARRRVARRSYTPARAAKSSAATARWPVPSVGLRGGDRYSASVLEGASPG